MILIVKRFVLKLYVDMNVDDMTMIGIEENNPKICQRLMNFNFGKN